MSLLGVVFAIGSVLGLQMLFMSCNRYGAHNLPARHHKQLHLARRLQHLLSGLAIIAVHHVCYDRLASGQEILVSPRGGVVILLCAALGFYTVHAARLVFPSLNTVVVRLMKNILREEEARGEKVPASFHFLLGAAVVLHFFPAHSGHIFRMALLLLSVGDPAAGLFGTLIGQTRWPGGGGKTVEGSLGCAFACSLAAAMYFYIEHRFFDYSLISCTVDGQSSGYKFFDSNCVSLSCLIGLIGAVSELISLPLVDDNFSMPVAAAVALWCTHKFYVPWAN